jgi:predicted GNAT family acetyltransferase
MEIVNLLSAELFLEKVQAFLEEDEVNGNLILGISSNLLKNKYSYGSEEPFFSVAYDDKKAVLISIMTPPHRLILYPYRNFSDGIMESFANNVYSKYKNIPGISGEVNAARSFVEKWTAITKCESSIDVRMRAFKLTSVNPYNKPDGIFRNAEEKEMDLITQFMVEFSTAIKEPTSMERAKQKAENGIRNKNIYVWENGGIVAMAIKVRPTKHGMAVSSVYTPEEHRNKGYATAIVSGLSQNILDSGKTFCTLFTDLSNPTSNSIYQKIGYKPAGDNISYVFEYKEQPSREER